MSKEQEMWSTFQAFLEHTGYYTEQEIKNYIAGYQITFNACPLNIQQAILRTVKDWGRRR